MNIWTLAQRSFRFYFKSHLAAVAGVAIATAAISGALIVGDSVRGTLRSMALARTAGAAYAISGGDRLFRAELKSIDPRGAPALLLPGVARHSNGNARANNVQIIGITPDYLRLNGNVPPSWPGQGEVWLNRGLSDQLDANVGDAIILRVQKPGFFTADAALASREDRTFGWRVKVAGILDSRNGGDLDLRGSGIPALNAFVPLEALAREAGVEGKANLLLFPEPAKDLVATYPAALEEKLRAQWRQEDVPFELSMCSDGAFQFRSPRVFLDWPLQSAIAMLGGTKQPILTYLANLIEKGTNATPYSMITAAGPPYTPRDLAPDEIVITDWLAKDLNASVGDLLRISWFAPDSGANLEQATNTFKIRQIVPLQGIYADPTLMPPFPGIEGAEKTHDWKGGFPLTYKIRPQDEAYWERHRGTPKAYVSLASGQRMWGNRFGDLTAVRFPSAARDTNAIAKSVLKDLDPAAVGYSVQSIRKRALEGASKSQDFSGLFIGFSLFIVASALLLLAQLFRFSLESRAEETGILRAAGFRSGKLKLLALLEAAAVGVTGAIAGTWLAVAYAATLLWALRTIWSDAVARLAMDLHVETTTLISGAIGGLALALMTVLVVLRKHGAKPVRQLLSGETETGSFKTARRGPLLISTAALVAAGIFAAAALARGPAAGPQPGLFFGAGAALLTCGCSFFVLLLRGWGRRTSMGETGTRTSPPPVRFSLRQLALNSAARRPGRSLSVVALLASSCFVIITISIFRLETPGQVLQKKSGTGGFSLIATTSLGLPRDISQPEGQIAMGLAETPEKAVHVVPLRVKEGDEASCLNLNRSGSPRLLGVNPALFQDRFKFKGKGDWSMLRGVSGNVIPAIGDANSIEWAMNKRVGQRIQMKDDQGRPFELLLVGAVESSILQGSLVIDETAFKAAFPSVSGHRLFLIEAAAPEKVRETWTSTLEDLGCEMVSTAERLAALNAVQNTYLGTFQMLGALGLLLGSTGLGILVLRNVLERRRELAVLQAAGFSKNRLARLLMSEHMFLLLVGLAIGVVSAMASVLPALQDRAPSWGAVAIALAAMILNGFVWTWLSVKLSMSGSLTGALRNE